MRKNLFLALVVFHSVAQAEVPWGKCGGGYESDSRCRERILGDSYVVDGQVMKIKPGVIERQHIGSSNVTNVVLTEDFSFKTNYQKNVVFPKDSEIQLAYFYLNSHEAEIKGNAASEVSLKLPGGSIKFSGKELAFFENGNFSYGMIAEGDAQPYQVQGQIAYIDIDLQLHPNGNFKRAWVTNDVAFPLDLDFNLVFPASQFQSGYMRLDENGNRPEDDHLLIVREKMQKLSGHFTLIPDTFRPGSDKKCSKTMIVTMEKNKATLADDYNKTNVFIEGEEIKNKKSKRVTKFSWDRIYRADLRLRKDNWLEDGREILTLEFDEAGKIKAFNSYKYDGNSLSCRYGRN